MTILHGENTVASREHLTTLISAAKQAGTAIERVESTQLTRSDLEILMGSTDLFGTQKLLIIEQLHSLPKSKRKDELITLLAKPTQHSIILWEKRALTPTMLKAFPGATVNEYKASSSLFNWLDSLSNSGEKTKKLTLLHEALQKDGEYLCFTLLVRHIRLLLLAKAGGTLKGPPFLTAKYKKQAQVFSESQLRMLHTRLVTLDDQAKSSRLSLNLESQLDLLTIGVYI